MKQRPRIYYTDQQKALMWERWQPISADAAPAEIVQRPGG